MELYIKIIFFTVIISSATEEEKNLTGTEGANITLPDPVVEKGFLSFERNAIAAVIKREVEILEKIYTNRLHWDNNTGLFTITGLQRNDSGIYTIVSIQGRILLTSYKLTVYESVSTPAVNTVSVSTESCILLCSVEKAEETTLLWYKDEEILNQSSSALSLPLTVHKQDFSSSHRCVAANPAENKTLPVDITTSCSEPNSTDRTSDSNTQSWLFLFPMVVFGSAVVVFIILINVKLERDTVTAAPSSLHSCAIFNEVPE